MTITRRAVDDAPPLHKKVVKRISPPVMSEGSSDVVTTRSITSSEQRSSPERRKLRNEDSSYDSDFEPCDLASPQECHEEISRTVSETLGAEFAEYVTSPRTLKQAGAGGGKPLLQAKPAVRLQETKLYDPAEGAPPPPTKATAEEEGTCSIAAAMASPDYPQRVEFGVKLGYSETLIQLALTKLGPNPDKNKLLDELIRLDAGAPKNDSDTDDPEPESIIRDEYDSNSPLRPIIIDGSNVAMSHGNQTTFSCRGIKLCVDWFRQRGHKEITVFVPQFRKEASKVDSAITDRELLVEMEREGCLCFTPSKSISGKRIVAYDDRYVLKEAVTANGVVVSNDNFRDLMNERDTFRKVVEDSLLMYSWVKGRFEPPEDPFGRNGPSLDAFLKRTAPRAAGKEAKTCPYGRKCTYGNKCKFTHPERGIGPMKSVTQRLQEHAQRHYQEKERAISRDTSPGDSLRAKTLSLPVTGDVMPTKRPVFRTHSNAQDGEYHLPPNLRAEAPLSTCSLPLKQQSTSGGVMSTASHRTHDEMAAKTPVGLPTYVSQMKGVSQAWNCYMEPPEPTCMPLSKMSLTGQLSEQQDSIGSSSSSCDYNRHIKLQRQLSINPVHDARLANKFLVEEAPTPYLPGAGGQSMNAAKFMAHHCLQEEQQQQPTRSHMRGKSRAAPPFFGYPSSNDLVQQPLPNYHAPVTRHSSSHETSQPVVSSYGLYPPYVHSHVTRNLSAPDAVWGHNRPPVKYHTRLNSTSDSHLNIHASCSDPFAVPAGATDPFDDPVAVAAANVPYPPPIVATNPGPVGSRPMSPQQQQSLSGGPMHHSHLLRMPQMSAAAMNAQQQQQQVPCKGYEDERFKIFYHLSQLFPEAQVRAALVRNPQETDPTKICASILNIAADHAVVPAMPAGMGQFPFSGGSPGDQMRGAFSPHPTESARIEAYSVLSKLFIEEQVRKVLNAYPDETDPTKLCMLLVALNSNPT